jgi:preprotein translocase subunit YajC
MIVALIAVFYFFAIRRRASGGKKAQEMRNSIEVGDSIVTVGGMIGKVVFVNDEKLTFETGEDRVRIEVQKWAVSRTKARAATRIRAIPRSPSRPELRFCFRRKIPFDWY